MKRYLSALASVFFLVSCVSENGLHAPDSSVSSNDESDATCIAGEAYVKFSDKMLSLIENDLTDGNLVTRSAGLNQSLESLGITSFRRVFEYAGEFEPRTRAEGLHRWYHVTYSPTITMAKASDNLMQIEGVEFVEPVRKIEIKTDVKFNDLKSELWGLYNQTNPGVDINVKPVWENYTVGSPDVIVAVVDQGVDVNHPDLKDNCLASGHQNFIGGNKVIGGSHGTHVAGTISAVNNNGIGISSIAGGDKNKGLPGVKILSLQIFDENDAMGDSAPAIKAAADKGALICQNSWGYSYDRNDDDKIDNEEMKAALSSKVSQVDKEAIDYFIKYAGCDNYGNQLPNSLMKGGLVVFAAGNDAITNCAPANYEKVIAVGAIASDGKRADFSNYGDWVDICAPGVDILSTVPGGNYDFNQGTSMACPHVSGVAALLLSYYGQQGFTADMLKAKILASANKEIVLPSYKIGGLLDAYGAFTYGDTSVPEAISDLTASGRGDNIDLSWTQGKDSGDKPVYAARVIYGKDRSKVEAATSNSFDGCEIYTHVIDVNVGETTTCTVRELEFSQTYYCKVFNYTYSMNYSDASEIVAVQTTENNAPEIVAELPSEGIALEAYQKLSLEINVSDFDDHDFTVDYMPGSEADKLTKKGAVYTIEITPLAAPEGTYEGTLTVTDKHGAFSSIKVPYTILSNTAPVKLKDMEDIFLKSRAEEVQFNMSEYVSDADGEPLTYVVDVQNPQIVYLSPKENILYLTPLKYGQSNVTVTAKDARGEKVMFEFNVMIKDPSQPVSFYPNPVKDYLNVGTMDKAETSISLCSSTGKLVYEGTADVSALEPARIDMRNCAPGVYTVTVKFSGKEYSETVVKL